MLHHWWITVCVNISLATKNTNEQFICALKKRQNQLLVQRHIFIFSVVLGNAQTPLNAGVYVCLTLLTEVELCIRLLSLSHEGSPAPAPAAVTSGISADYKGSWINPTHHAF